MSPLSVLHQIQLLNLVKNKNGKSSNGNSSDKNQVIIKPILLTKNDTKIALYFVDHIPETKLSTLLFYDNIKFEQPSSMTKKHLTILILNQRRNASENRPNIAPT
jgi:double-strand break repair protein MRE11